MNTRVRKQEVESLSGQASQSSPTATETARRRPRAKRDGRKIANRKKAQTSRATLQTKRTGSAKAAKSAKSIQPSKQVVSVPPPATETAAETIATQELCAEKALPESAIVLPGGDRGEILLSSVVEQTAPAADAGAIVEAGNELGLVESAAESKTDLDENSANVECDTATDELITTQSAEPWWKGLFQTLSEKWSWAQNHIKVRRIKKRLRVCETVSLGEKRFVAVIQVDGEEFLVGGASNSVSTLARLERPQEFSDVLKQRWAEDPTRA